MKYLKRFESNKDELEELILNIIPILNDKFKLLGIKFSFFQDANALGIFISYQSYNYDNSLLDIIAKSYADYLVPYNKENYLTEALKIVITRNKNLIPTYIINRIDQFNSNTIYHIIETKNNEILIPTLNKILISFKDDFKDDFRFFSDNMDLNFTKKIPSLKELIVYYTETIINNSIDYDKIAKLFYKSIESSNYFQAFKSIEENYPLLWDKLKQYKTNTDLALKLGQTGF